MILSKPVRILVGVTTIWYSVYLLLMIIGIVILFGYLFLALTTGVEAVADLQNFLMQIMSFGLMLPIHVCSLVLEVGLLIFYLVHTIKNTKASDSLRIVLGLGHLFLPLVAMPVYYYLYIWRERPPEWASARALKVEQFAKSVL